MGLLDGECVAVVDQRKRDFFSEVTSKVSNFERCAAVLETQPQRDYRIYIKQIQKGAAQTDYGHGKSNVRH